METNALEARVSELETVVTFQEQTISSLSSELFIQQEKLKEIDRSLKALVKSYKENIPQASAEHEVPPHYWKEWWPEAASNCRHEDFQSTALPTELSGHAAILPH